MTASASASIPLRILVSPQVLARHGERIRACASPAPTLLTVDDVEQRGAGFDAAFVSRDVTGLSTKHETLPETQHFYDALLGSKSLRWMHFHSAGADRPVYLELIRRGVVLTSSAGSNAEVVAQTAVTGLLMLGRRFPEMLDRQRRGEWAPLIERSPLPADIHGQTATIVGWGGIGQAIARILGAIGLKIQVVRSSGTPTESGLPSFSFEDIGSVLAHTDWLILACPLTDRTRQLIDAKAIAKLPAGAHLINVSRGDVVDETALIEALQGARLAGAYLDVFAHEPLAKNSPLWNMPNVIATPHSAGFSAGNAARVVQIFLENLERFACGKAMANVVR
ncbi:D-2-hydroxyacid dehydrogenase [Diaphorobacter ruginosibacter]|uniref:D-2-hydroxyacid dehydrogenase n=1 Tax=Diaphorobacter ruginosibacter TaxID=1715720 RepID=UPI00333F0D14